MKPKSSSPPRLFHRFFRWYCKPSLLDHIEGDLIELYNNNLASTNRRTANIKFIKEVILLFRPGIIKTPKRPKHLIKYAMINSHFKIGWRKLLRNKGYSAINIGGLALGMTVAMLIGLWIFDELSYNKYHKNYEQIVQAWAGEVHPDTKEISGMNIIEYPLARVLRENYPQYFKEVAMSAWQEAFTLSIDNKKFIKYGLAIEKDAPSIFSFNMIKGNYADFGKQNAIFISRSTAVSLFGNDDPINKFITIGSMNAEVTGVYEDLPRNSRFAGTELFITWSLWLSVNNWAKTLENSWANRSFLTYALLQPGVSVEKANAVVKDLYNKNIPPDLLATVAKKKPFLQLIPMNTWHLYSEFKNGKPATGRITFVWLFGTVGAFVLLLACINFINLSTAQSEKRAREVGVRKTIGSGRRQLISQFLSESFLVVIFGFVLSVGLLLLVQNLFNQLAGKEMPLPFNQPLFWIIMVGFIIITGLMAGLYPAFYLSSFKPVKVLKGVLSPGRFASMPRKILVVVQFAVSVILIIGTLIVYKQIEFARDRPVGFTRQSLLSANMSDPNYQNKKKVIETQLMNTGMVAAIGNSTGPLTAIWNNTGGYDWPGKDPAADSKFAGCGVSEGFGKAVGWQIVSGRDFSPMFATDSSESIIINEAAARYMHLKDPIGIKLTDLDNTGKVKWTKSIIGVAKDLVMESPYDPVRPTLYSYSRHGNILHLKLNPLVSASVAIPKIKAVVESVLPTAIFDYKFIDEEYARKFSQEVRIGKLSGVFAVIAIFISCLGLFGLASFVAEQRTKEIGIRKVMGASVSYLWQLLSKDFVVLVVISCFIAMPIGYYMLNNWLQQYNYRTNLPWWIFALTCLAAIVITLITVSFQSIRAAKMNPVKSLRSQ
jgi:putative ABC transport system permease protein